MRFDGCATAPYNPPTVECGNLHCTNRSDEGPFTYIKLEYSGSPLGWQNAPVEFLLCGPCSTKVKRAVAS